MDDRLRAIFRLQTVDLRGTAATEAGGALRLSDVDLRLSGGTRLTLAARIAGADLTPASWAGGALTELDLDWKSDGRLARPVMELLGEAAAGEGGDAAVDAARGALAGLVAALPEASLAPGTRDELAAMVADLPQGRGRLVLRLVAEDGIGAARLGLAALRDAPLGAEALAGLLAGATLSADWQPGLSP
jgi:hypothetical protein